MIQIDRHTVIQVFGSLMNQPSLLNDTDKYRLEISDFPTTLDRFIYSAIYNLYNGGVEKIRTIDIISYLKENPTATVYLEKENGEIFLQDCESTGEPQNFNYYYNKLKKLNLLKDIQSTGRSIEQFYCEDIFNPKYNEINEKFDKLTIKDIIDSLRNEVNIYENKFELNSIAEESRAVDGIRELIDDLKKGPEIGCKLQGDIFNTICRGGRKGKLYIRSALSGVGKALPNNVKIPTPNGWTTVGEVQVGDYLFDKFGNPTKVLAIYPQKEKKQVYKVYFKSGRVAECCSEHLWSYFSNLNNKKPNKLITSTLQEIIDNPKGLQNNSGSYRYSIPICKPVQYSKKQFSIDPYVMGLILGDGSFRYSNEQKSFYFSSNDEELVEQIQKRMKYSSYKKNSKMNYNWIFKSNFKTHKSVWVEDILKNYPELWNKKSEDKFIPQDFLFGSIEQRFDLLAGLLDTDGSIDEKGRINFSTTSFKLKDNIIELCESLGMICSYLIDNRNEKYTTGKCYKISIKTTPENKIKMFKLKRKVNIANNYLDNNKRKERRDRDAIVKIEATNTYTDMTCFYVDNKEHLFLMNNFIVTHNTRSMVGDACQIAYPIRYDRKSGKWISTGSAEKVLYIMTEQDPEEIKTMILSYLTGYNEEIFLYGTYGEKEMPRIQQAIDIMEKYSDNMLFARIPDPCASVIKNLFRRYHIQNGVENFFYDYIFSSPAMLEEYRDLKLPEHVCLRLFTTALKNLAVELDSFVLTSTQVSNEDDNKEGGFRDFRNIRGSRAIVDTADLACIMSRPTKNELNQLQGFQNLFSFVPNLVTDVFKNRGNRWTMVRIWSYNDLGSCRREDLFITTSQMYPIKDFQIIDFVNDNENEFDELLDLYNDGIVSDNVYEEFYSLSDEKPEDLLKDAADSFNDINEQKQRVKEKSFEDLLSF